MVYNASCSDRHEIGRSVRPDYLDRGMGVIGWRSAVVGAIRCTRCC